MVPNNLGSQLGASHKISTTLCVLHLMERGSYCIRSNPDHTTHFPLTKLYGINLS